MKKMRYLLLLMMAFFSLMAHAQYKLLPVQSEENKKWGFKDTSTGKIVIDCQYDKAEYFYDSLAKVMNDGKWGMIDVNGKVVLKIDFEEIHFNYGQNIIAKDKKGWGVYAKDGTRNEKVQGYEYLMQNSYMQDDEFIFSEGKNMGLIKADGKVIIPASYRELYPCSENENAYVALHKGLFALIATNGEMIITLDYSLNEDDLSSIGSDGHVAFFNESKQFILNDGKKWGVINAKGEEIIPFKYNGIKFYQDQKNWGRFLVAELNKGNEVELVDKDLKPISDEPIEGILGYYADYSNYLVIKLADDDRLMFYDGDNHKVIQEIDYLKHKRMKAYYAGKLNGKKYGVVTHKGEVVIPYEYDFVMALDYKARGLDKKHFLVKKDHQNGVFEVGTGIVVPIKYKSINYVVAYRSEFLSVKDESGRVALADMKGNLLTEFKYKSIWGDRRTQRIYAKTDAGEKVILDNKGKEVN